MEPRPDKRDAEISRLRAENERLLAFAIEVLDAWPEGDLDGGNVQDAAVKHGLLVPTTQQEPCGEDCWCAEYYGEFPTTCYRRTRLIGGSESVPTTLDGALEGER